MMSPDLNSVPASPRNRAPASHSHSPPTSRRPSQMTGTPLLPGVTSSNTVPQDTTAVPVRHPRPLTAAELHLELEKEQEAVVNRLTRELSALRAQHSASVASTTSSSSAIEHPQYPPSAENPQSSNTNSHIIIGPGQPTSSRRHRSSSSLSSRSNRSTTSQPSSATPASTAVAPVAGTSQASVDRARDAAGIGVGVATGLRSRENSLAGMPLVMPSRSRAPSASPHPSPLLQQHHGLYGPPATVDPTSTYFSGSTQSHRPSVSSTSSASARYEEAAVARAALEVARKENEMLATRVRELEAILKEKQSRVEDREQRSGSRGQDEPGSHDTAGGSTRSDS